MNKNFLCFFCYFSLPVFLSAQTIIIPLGGNSWVNNAGVNAKDTVTENGWENWESATAVWSTYFYVSKPGSLSVKALITVPTGKSTIAFSIDHKQQLIDATGIAHLYHAGTWQIKHPGYVKLTARGIRKTAGVFGNIASLQLSGTVINDNIAFVKNNDGDFFYWGRRGPSVHINYDLSTAPANIEWFYSEITVPKGSDVSGSYFMADGFGEGYFGMQVNSATERRVIFSVWSPFNTDDPKLIPSNKRVILEKKGTSVVAEDFGNEGSGGHSHLVYDWKAGQAYKFLLRGQPGADSNTNYTAYFFDNNTSKWLLIASFTRPATHTYLTRLHSFLENFDPEQGAVTRKAYYHNQWIKPANGDWMPINKMTVTTDNTGRKRFRMDYGGGLEKGMFYLKNGGFFNDAAQLKKPLISTAKQTTPVADLLSLVALPK